MAYVVVYQNDRVVARHPLLDELVIGRGADCDLVLDDSAVSRRHCLLEMTDAGWAVNDPGSRNGTFVGGMPVRNFLLSDGDEIHIGDTLLEFREASLPPQRPSHPEEALRISRESQSAETRVTIERVGAPKPQPRAW